jgi:hypothetical protein
MPIIQLTDKHRNRLNAYIAYFSDKGFLFENICERCNIIKGNADYDTDLIVGFFNAELCFEKETAVSLHGYPDGLTLQDWLNKVETLYMSHIVNIKVDASTGKILDNFNWVGSFNS